LDGGMEAGYNWISNEIKKGERRKEKKMEQS